MTSISMTSRDGLPRFPKLLALGCGLAALTVVALLATQGKNGAGTTAPATATPSSAARAPVAAVQQLGLVHAETFQVAQPFRHVWRSDQPLVDRGWLLVLSGDPALLEPRQSKEPVLYVGAQTATRVNTARDSGRLVVIVPGDFRLQDAPIFFGSVALPEEVGPHQIAAELANAVAAGAKAPTAAEIAAAGKAPGQTFPTDYELWQRAIDLVEQFSPTEQTLIEGWRAPRVR